MWKENCENDHDHRVIKAVILKEKNEQKTCSSMAQHECTDWKQATGTKPWSLKGINVIGDLYGKGML